jgi:hypothetical protein
MRLAAAAGDGTAKGLFVCSRQGQDYRSWWGRYIEVPQLNSVSQIA